LTKNVKKC